YPIVLSCSYLPHLSFQMEERNLQIARLVSSLQQKEKVTQKP
ncbi:243_t:CDS:1, partial [Cetraspora pellucida]